MRVIDHQKRIFEGYATVEVKDKDGDLFPVSDVLKYMIDYADIGGVLHDTHTYKVVGKMLNWTETDKNGVPAIRITGKIYDNLPMHDVIWGKIKEGEYGGLSIGGEGTLTDGELKIDGGVFEISVCERGANHESTIEAVSFAKSGKDCDKMDVTKEKKYLKPGEKPPKGAQVQQGKRGGQYYETGGSVSQETRNEANHLANNIPGEKDLSDREGKPSEGEQPKVTLDGDPSKIKAGKDGEPDSYYYDADDDTMPSSREDLVNPEKTFEKFDLQALRDIKEIDNMIYDATGVKSGGEMRRDPKRWEQYKKFVANNVMPKIANFSIQEQASLFLSLEDANYHTMGKALSELGMKTSYDADYNKGDTMKKSIKKQEDMLPQEAPAAEVAVEEEVEEVSKLDSILEIVTELASKVSALEERMGTPPEEVTEAEDAPEEKKEEKPEEKTEEDEEEKPSESKKLEEIVKVEVKKALKNITKAKTPNPSVGDNANGKSGGITGADIAMGRAKM